MEFPDNKEARMSTTSGSPLLSILGRLLLTRRLSRSRCGFFRGPSSTWLANVLVTTATKLLPGRHRDRYRREWLADLHAFRESRRGSGLGMALGILMTSPRIRWTLRCSYPGSNSKKSRFLRRTFDILFSCIGLLV